MDHLGELTGPIEGGLHINRINVDLEDGCKPERLLQEQLQAIPFGNAVGAAGPERTRPASLLVSTSDGIELSVDGFVATYSILDRSRLVDCVGSRTDALEPRLQTLAARSIGNAIQGLPFDRLEVSAERLAVDLQNQSPFCGVSFDGIDFSGATLSRRSVIVKKPRSRLASRSGRHR